MSGGLPRMAPRSEEEWIAQFLSVSCGDPALDALAANIACAVARARPQVTLPPHLFRPWRARDVVREGRLIIPDTAGLTSGAAGVVGSAEEVTVADSASDQAVISYTIPQPSVLIAYAITVEGYDEFSQDDSNLVFSAKIGERAVDLFNNDGTLLGITASRDRPLAVCMAGRQGEVFKIVATNNSATSWHMAEASFRGYLIDASYPDESIEGLLEPTRCERQGRPR